MNLNCLLGRLLLLIPFVGLFSGCSDLDSDRDVVIAAMVKQGMAKRADILKSSDEYSDYKIYRDGIKYGVICEYVIADGGTIDRSQLTPDIVKRRLVGSASPDPTVTRLLRLGIYMQLIYKDSDGNVICDVTISKADL